MLDDWKRKIINILETTKSISIWIKDSIKISNNNIVKDKIEIGLKIIPKVSSASSFWRSINIKNMKRFLLKFKKVDQNSVIK